MNHYKYSVLNLSSGEVIITEVSDFDEEDYVFTLKNPIKIITNTNKTTKVMQLYSYPYVPLLQEDEPVELSGYHIVSVTPANEEVLEYYLESVDHIYLPEGDDGKLSLSDVKLAEKMKRELAKGIIQLANTSIH